jgi:hypothetical protein
MGRVLKVATPISQHLQKMMLLICAIDLRIFSAR